MKISPPPPDPLLASALFAAVVADVHRDSNLLGHGATLVLFAAAAASLVLASLELRRRARLAILVTVVLLLGASSSLGLKLLGLDTVLRRSQERWLELQRAEADAIADVVAARFASLSREAREIARELSRSSTIAVAVEGSDAQDYRTEAFRALDAAALPRAHPAGEPGVTLYDVRRRPFAWSGENVSLDPFLSARSVVPDPEVFILERGVLTYLVAVEPLLSRLGFVSVEVPLVADRRLQNRYVQDFDALSSWAHRSIDADFLAFDEDESEIVAWFESRGGKFWGGADEAPRLYFPLRSGEGVFLGSSSVPGETPVIARLEARRRFTLASASVLSLSAAIVWLLVVGRAGPRVTTGGALVVVAAAWGARLVPLLTGLPLGLGLDLGNPAHYASSLPLGLARSPIDLLLTSAAALFSVLVLGRAVREPFSTKEPPPQGRRAARWLACGAALAVFTSLTALLRNAWVNSNAALATVSLSPLDAPKIVVQLALVLLFLAGGALAVRLLGAAQAGGVERSPWRKLAAGISCSAGLVAAAWFLLRDDASRECVLLAVPPLVAAHALSVFRPSHPREERLGKALAPLGRTFVAILLAVASFYPALAHFGANGIEAFIETTVRPLVLQHGRSRLFVLTETAQSIDRMREEGRLAWLEREDQAFRIWVSTDLYASSLSSSVELFDAQGELRSRFAASLPLSEAPPEQPPAPTEWIWDEQQRHPDPRHPGVLVARRSIEGPDGLPWEIRLELAADWRNLPFISTANPYLSLIRPAGVEASSRFPHRELDLFVLAPDGTSVFQSTEGTLALDREQLERARTESFWVRIPFEDESLQAHVFSDESYVYVLAYPREALRSYAAELAAWVLVGTGIFALAVGLSLLAGWTGRPGSLSVRNLRDGVVGSFYGKLYVALVLVALVPIVFVSFLVRGIFVHQLERDVEQEGVARARVVERFVRDLIVYERSDLEPEGASSITNGVLEWVGSLADVEADLFVEGELLATSKPELFDSGLLRRRAAPSAYRDIMLRRLSQSIHRESVGSFPYRVVSVPLALGPWREPGMLSLPLASRQREIERKVTALNQAVLLTALGFVLGAAALARSIARRIADPVKVLTVATHRVATGDLDVSLESASRDEIGVLFSSFNRMTSDLKRQRLVLERTKKLEAWAEMARQVAHEVKNPLTPIQLATEHLRRVFRDPDVDFEKVLDQCSDTILQQVRTLRQISMEFSTFASPEPLRKEPTDLERLVRESIAPYVQAPPNGVSVRVEVAPQLPRLHADKRLLRRTVVNLVENALHALNGSGEVRIDVTALEASDGRPHSLIVDVSDTGVGVDPEVRDRIFEPYFSTRAAGTGLGLAIAKKVVEDHGGEIGLTSSPGRGTTVRLRLPVTEEAPP